MKGKILIGSLLSIPLVAGAGCFALDKIRGDNLQVAENNVEEEWSVMRAVERNLRVNFDYCGRITPQYSPYELIEICDDNAFREKEKCSTSHVLCRGALKSEPEYDFFHLQRVQISKELLACTQGYAQCVEENVMPLAQEK